MIKPEILCPAGDFERLKIAILYGADAVYCGGKNYSLRANATNFSNDELKEAVKYVHKHNKKIYITINIVFHDKDFKNLISYLYFLSKIKVDGVIVSDIAVINIINKENINLDIIVSTQCSVLNKKAAQFYKNLGCKRVVLAREAMLKDIKAIKSCGIEVEMFIQGAMCTNFSGQCILSNYFTNRDSNRGGCAQVCRWNFACEEGSDFSIMPKDLNSVSNIKTLMELGVDSFKIEGRMRSIYYIATVCLVYKKVIDLIITNKIDDEYIIYYQNILNRCANRDSVPQFLNNLPDEKAQYYTGREEASNQDFIGIVLDYDENKSLIKLEVRNFFQIGYVLQIFGPNTETFDLIVENIYDESGVMIEKANHPMMNVFISCNQKVEKLDMIRIKTIDKIEKK